MRSGVTLNGNEQPQTGEATKKASVCQQSESPLYGDFYYLE
ncbi:hypothetical protein [Bacillus sp. AFS088145]|nr:hypothetical protein [Bacillus sp. AFS088145]